MPRKKSKIPYRCSFCREHLVNVEADLIGRLEQLLLIRRFQCPHCFAIYRRPLAFIGRLCCLGRAGGARGAPQAEVASPPEEQASPDTDNSGPTARHVAECGRECCGVD